MRPITLLLSLQLLALTSMAGYGATYIVAQRDPGSDDNGPGNHERPWKTISKAARSVVAGDTVLIREGIYREQVTVTNSGTADAPIRFEAAPESSGVLITGADKLTGWKRLSDSKAIFELKWPHRFIAWSKHMTHPDDEYHRLIGRCEQVAIEQYLLRQVLEPDQLAPGTFFVDVSNLVLRVWDAGSRDISKLYCEASTRQELFRIEGAHVQVRGLHFRYAANMAQHGAVVLGGAHDVLEDCVLEDMNSSGATFVAPDQIVRRCVFRDNGQIGFGANGAHRLRFTECLVENNNTKGFDRGWEAGGDKLVLCRDVVLERSRFVRNHGNGIWFDIGNEHCTVQDCFIADNEDSGIFCEISFGLQAHDNVITGNGFAPTQGAWGAQAGIALSSSPGCRIERNLMVANREGFNFREQTRTTPRIGGHGEEPVWNHDEEVVSNIIAFNRDAQIWGWFDTRDNRHWPAKTIEAGPVAEDRNDSESSGSGNLTLEKLKLRFDGNIYAAGAGQGWFDWGVTWTRHKSYSSLGDFQKDLRIDSNGRVLDPEFLNRVGGDFRVSRPIMAKLSGCYPQGLVPSVMMGIAP
jgi:Right handed beta helix region